MCTRYNQNNLSQPPDPTTPTPNNTKKKKSQTFVGKPPQN